MLDMAALFLIPLAFLLDKCFGDPPMPFLPWKHPVCYVGSLLHTMEKVARFILSLSKGGVGPRQERLLGIVCLAFVVLCVGSLVYFSLSTLLHVAPWLGLVLALYLAYTGLAAQSLLDSCATVLQEVEQGTQQDAQKALSYLVSRDTTVLDRDALRKSLADTLSENVTDAVVAPLFWFVVGSLIGKSVACGVAVLWMYKAVSTADSMWGYKTPKWLYLGFGAAKADDIVAYIPARLAVLFLFIANIFTKTSQECRGAWPGFARIFQEARGMESPNSGLPMAAAAWLCGAGLGGPTFYFGAMVHKPWVGGYDSSHSVGAWNKYLLQQLASLVNAANMVAFALLFSVFVGIFVGI